MTLSYGLYDYLDDLSGAASAEGCLAAMQRHANQLGFGNVLFAYTPRPGRVEETLGAYTRLSTIPRAWEDRYSEMGYQNHCPLYRESLREGTLPLIWQQIWDRADATAEVRQMRDEGASVGMTQGISIPIKEANSDRCAIALSNDLDQAECARIIEQHLPRIFLMSHHFHAIMVDRYIGPRAVENIPRLTGRELDCLYWVSIGKNTWEMSEIHGISENTVKYHLRNILSKLNVTTRAAAVAKAFRLGLLDF